MGLDLYFQSGFQYSDISVLEITEAASMFSREPGSSCFRFYLPPSQHKSNRGLYIYEWTELEDFVSLFRCFETGSHFIEVRRPPTINPPAVASQGLALQACIAHQSLTVFS